MPGAHDTGEAAVAAAPEFADGGQFAQLMEQGRAQADAGDLQSAIETFRRALALRPDDEAALERISLALINARRFAEADAHFARLRAMQAERLPQHLTDGLAALWRRTDDIVRDDLESAALQWAWELADRSTWNYDAWLAAAAWGNAARRLLRDWWEAASERQLGELIDLIEPPDLTGLRAALVESKGCILVGAHVGPTAAAVHMFRRGNRPFRTLGTADRDRAYGDTLVPIVPHSIVTMRTLVKQIRTGTMIGLLADDPIARDRLAVPFLGRTVELPLLIPKLIQHYGTASFWCCPLWRGGRIVIELARLPEPAADEPGDVWCERWFAAYLARLEPVMRGRPENLGLFSGIWSNVNPAVLQRRERQPSRIRRPQADPLR